MHFVLEIPFLPRELDGLEKIFTGLSLLQESPVFQHWSSFRKIIENESLEAIRTSCREALEKAIPGLPSYLDTHWATLKRVTKIDQDLAERLYPYTRADRLKARDYCYWMFGSDLLGRGKGWSKTNLGKQFGDVYGFDVTPRSVTVPCPLCGETARLVVRDLHPTDPFEIGFHCPSCDHSETIHQYRPDLVRTSCQCPACQSLVQNLAHALEQDARQLGHVVATNLRERARKIQDVYFALSNHQNDLGNPPPEVIAFAQAVLRKPGAFIGDILDEVSGHKAGIFHPYTAYVRWESQLRDLLKYKLVHVQVSDNVEALDDQEVLELAFVDRDTPFRTEQRLREKSAALTGLLKGFNAADESSFRDWATIMTKELNLKENWFPLPVTFYWETDEPMIRALLGTPAQSPASDILDHVYIYPVSDQTISEAVHAFASPILALRNGALWHAREELYAQIVGPARTALCADLLRQLTDEAPSLAAQIPEIETRLKGRLPPSIRSSLYDQSGKLLLNYLYWMHCREVIGDATGVMHKDIMAIFDIQTGVYRAAIQPVSLPWNCPGCGAESEVHGIRLTKNKIEQARLSCLHCGHNESLADCHYDYDLNSNTLACPCPRCTDLRLTALSTIRSTAATLPELLIDLLLKCRQEVDFKYAREYSCTDHLVVALSAGYSLEESRRLLFADSFFDNHSNHLNAEPSWAISALQDGILSVEDREQLTGDTARTFLRSELLHVINRVKPVNALPCQDWASDLASENPSLALQTLRDLLNAAVYHRFALPSRYKASVDWDQLRSYVENHGLDMASPRHYLRHLGDKDPEDVDARPWHISWWPSNDVPSPRPTARHLTQQEIEAVQLLERLGYTVTPPP